MVHTPWVGGTSPEGSGTSMEGSYHPREVGSTWWVGSYVLLLSIVLLHGSGAVLLFYLVGSRYEGRGSSHGTYMVGR